MIPASMSVDSEHAATYRQQHGSPNIFSHWIKFFSSKNLQRECSCYWQNKRLTRFDTDSLRKYVWLLKFIEGQANEYTCTSNHGFKTPKSCVDFGTSEYIPGEVGLDPANHPKRRVHSSQDEGQHECQHKQPAHGGCRVHTILHLVLFNTHQTKLTLGSRLSSPHTNGFIWWLVWGWGKCEFGVLKNWNCLNVSFLMILTWFTFPNIFHYMLHLYICSCSTCFCISIVSLSV